MVKNLPANAERQKTRVRFLGQEDPLEKKIATHSRVLAWGIPGTGEPDGLPSMESHRVGQDLAAEHACSVILGLVFKYLFTYLFVWQHQVLVALCRIF